MFVQYEFWNVFQSTGLWLKDCKISHKKTALKLLYNCTETNFLDISKLIYRF